MKSDAVYTLARFATEGIESRPPEVQAEIYSALAEVLPDPKNKLAAEKIAFSIRETQKLQLEFTHLITRKEEL